MKATMVSGILQETVDGADDTALASDVPWCAWVAGGIFRCNDDGVADFEFAVR